MKAENESNAAIRTPDRRLRVFGGRPWPSWPRSAPRWRRAISALGLTPVMFELGARPHPPRELYRAYLAQSDIFIGVYWQRYGWIGPDKSAIRRTLSLLPFLAQRMYFATAMGSMLESAPR